jgi:hypothetical protein
MVEKQKNKQVANGNRGSECSRKLALEYDIDVLWIGARTTVNLQFRKLLMHWLGTENILVKIL